MKLRFKDENGNNYPDWDKKKLGEIGDVKMNRRIFANETSSEFEIPFYKIGTFGKTPDTYITYEKYLEYKEKYPYPNVGDILISASGTIGKTVVYNGEKAYFQDSNIVWFDHGNKISNMFLNQFYKIVRWKGIEGTTIKRLYNSNILNTNIIIPQSLEEQEKIGSFFKLQDEVIELKEKLIKEKREYKKGLLQKVFNQELRFKDENGNNYPDWEKKKLYELYSRYGSGGTPKSTNKEYYNGQIPFLSITDLTNSTGYIYKTDKKISDQGLKSSNAKIFPKGTICLAMYASVGKVGILKKDMATSQAFFNMVIDNKNTRNVIYQILLKMQINNDWRKLISTGTQDNLNSEKIKTLKLCFPKSLEEQEKIGNLFKVIDEEIELLENEVIKLKQKKKYYLSVMM